jgi:hypothetical protein
VALSGFTPAFRKDGGLTWSVPVPIAMLPDANLCEPGALRSPDGKQIAVLLRENSRKYNSFVIFSNDEGLSWTEPKELPAALTGDRHVAKYAPDGRLFISFRDTTHVSATKGDWVGWVGKYEDIVNGTEGQYRVRIMDNTKGQDTTYPASNCCPTAPSSPPPMATGLKARKPMSSACDSNWRNSMPNFKSSRRRFIAGLPALGFFSVQAADETPLQDIVFGSCLDTHEHPMLDRTLTLPRDLFHLHGRQHVCGQRRHSDDAGEVCVAQTQPLLPWIEGQADPCDVGRSRLRPQRRRQRVCTEKGGAG